MATLQPPTGAPPFLRWDRHKVSCIQGKPLPVHPHRCTILEKPVLVVREIVRGLEMDRVVFDKLPPLRLCCLWNPAVRVAWWDAVYRVVERLDPRYCDFIRRELSMRVREPNLEDEEAWRLYREWERSAKPKELKDTACRKLQLERAMDAARAKHATSDELWRRSERAWAEVADAGVKGRPDDVRAASSKAFALAADAMRREQEGGSLDPQKVARWREVVSAWRVIAPKVEHRARLISEARQQRRAQRAGGRRASAAGAPKDAEHAETTAALRVLGLSLPYTPEEVNRAQRAAARRHHPDAGGDAVRMVEINNAADVLRGALEDGAARSMAAR